MQNLQRSIAEDTVRNEYLFHAKIHEWLAAPGTSCRHQVADLAGAEGLHPAQILQRLL